MLELAERHKDFKAEVFKKVNESDIESLSTPEAKKAYNWNRQVAGCYQRSRAFARLNINKHSIIYGKIEPEHFVEDLVAKWFLSRFPIFTIMVESKRGTFVVSKDSKLRVYKETIDSLLPKFEKTTYNSITDALRISQE